MSSVIATWHGALSDRAAQDELLSYIERFAALNGEFLEREQKLPMFSEVLAAQRREGVPERSDFEIVDRVLSGGIIVGPDIFSEKEEFSKAAWRAGLPLEHPPSMPQYPVLRVASVALRGCDFRLFDPRRLYPGDDRLSFVFATCPEAPFLDGYLVTINPILKVAQKFGDVAKGADWFLECPYIHLRYVLEDWTFRLFCWVKYFFMPDLTWWGGEDLLHYEEEMDIFQRLEANDGREAAKHAGFFLLVEAFRADAESWSAQFAKIREGEDRWDDLSDALQKPR